MDFTCSVDKNVKGLFNPLISIVKYRQNSPSFRKMTRGSLKPKKARISRGSLQKTFCGSLRSVAPYNHYILGYVHDGNFIILRFKKN